MSIQKLTGTFVGSRSRNTTWDFTYIRNQPIHHIVLLCHGFKGFKDWGGFHFIAETLAEQGFPTFKFNFSHNGTSVAYPADFTDLDAFSINTFQDEINDLVAAEDFIQNELCRQLVLDEPPNLSAIGHSKGGVSLLLHQVHSETTIERVITWASPFDFHRFWSKEFIAEWRTRGMQYVMNSRTGQRMPLHLSILEDYEQQEQRYDLGLVLSKISIPVLCIHGSADTSVPLAQAEQLHQGIAGSRLEVIPNADHVFGMKHPFSAGEISPHLQKLLTLTTEFLHQSIRLQ
jgi:alpha-beta hydrolase superfamily lysophospholipase